MTFEVHSDYRGNLIHLTMTIHRYTIRLYHVHTTILCIITQHSQLFKIITEKDTILFWVYMKPLSSAICL